jgi:hypothetical protein
LDFLNKN